MKKLFRILVRAFASVVIFPMFSIIERIWKIRITPLHCARIGHMSVNTHMFLADRETGKEDIANFRVFFGASPCNRQLFDMWKRRLPLFESRLAWVIFNYTEDILSRLPTFQTLPANRAYPDQFELCVKSGPILDFTKEDKIRGKRLLRDLGIGEDDWFVCFQARDSAYHEMRAGADVKRHRNCEIETYLKAARFITSKGGFAIRVGQSVSEPLSNTNDDKIIDYSNEFRSDFGDVFLLGNCKFFLASATGTVSVSSLFDTPAAVANFIPYHPSPNTGGLFSPKLMKDNRTDRLMNFLEISKYLDFERKMTEDVPDDFADVYENEDVSLIDSSADDILNLCMDMYDEVEGREPSEEASALQHQFMDTLYVGCSDRVKFAPKVGPRFAMKYRDLIVPRSGKSLPHVSTPLDF